MRVICDIETDAIVNPKNIWSIVCKDIDNNEIHIWNPTNLKDFIPFSKNIRNYIGHNFLKYDGPVLNDLLPDATCTPDSITDTLIISRLLSYSQAGGHSLDVWGEYLGHKKSKFDNFSGWSRELENRCIQDVHINHELYIFFLKYIKDGEWFNAIKTEHEFQRILNEISTNGFTFNFRRAKSIYKTITTNVEKLTSELQTAFPPRSTLIREITPKATKSGTISAQDFRWLEEPKDLTPYTTGAPFSRIEFEEFNPGSPKQRIERLNEAGWKPFEKTKGHLEAIKNGSPRLPYFKAYGWKCSEDNLATLPEDAPKAAQKLVQWLLLDSRRSTMEEWFNAYNEDTGRVHGTYNGIGSWTHRVSHQRPNMANIPSFRKPNSILGRTLRSLWTVPEDRWLIGTDASSIQMRIFAHLVGDEEYVKQVIGEDIHRYHWELLGSTCPSRDAAKTFIYAFLLGAGVAKIASIFGCSTRDAGIAKENFLTNIPGLLYLKNKVFPNDVKRGWFKGLDGRKVIFPSEHYLLAGYLQNGEKTIMANANIKWYRKLKKDRVYFKQVNNVHDEWQTEVKQNREIAEYIGRTQVQSIIDTGEELNMRCPLDGEFKIGNNWYETH